LTEFQNSFTVNVNKRTERNATSRSIHIQFSLSTVFDKIGTPFPLYNLITLYHCVLYEFFLPVECFTYWATRSGTRYKTKIRDVHELQERIVG